LSPEFGRSACQIVRKIGLLKLSETLSKPARPGQRNATSGLALQAQQAAEKAVKSLHLALGQEAWGHAVARLLNELPVRPSEDLIDKAKVLDNFYIPTRYANSHPEGAPFQHYGRIHSDEAIRYAGEILEFVSVQMAGPQDG
jgi:HEPN domain-containing protein